MAEVGELLDKLQEMMNFVIAGLPLYRFAIALAFLFVFLFFRKLFVSLIVRSILKATQKTRTDIDDLVVHALVNPLSFLIVTAGIGIFLIVLGVDKTFVFKILRTLVVLTIGWASLNLISEFEPKFHEFTQKLGKEVSKEISGFLIKLAKSFVAVITVLAILQEWGINVGALLASLGLLGLAVSLAAKDTLENIISGLVILLDKPILTGEVGEVAGVQGTVEDIGLRSTKIRTFDKTLVTIPNKEVVNQKVENWSRRRRRRVRTYIGLVYSTTKEQMENILKDMREMLSNHPRVSKEEGFFVHFEVFGASSLDILVQYYTDTADYAEYLKIVEDVNLKIMDIVERNGSSFAFPSRSIYVENVSDLERAFERVFLYHASKETEQTHK